MKRLVYSPYVQAFVKTADGVFDLSPYILAGSVNRKVNQVSGAQLTLRNPVMANSTDLLFTEFPRGDGIGPLISPMDPIVISMTRLQNHPVQVFTGYVDKAPYIQLYPGVCTLEASCTLKRLLYTQWDAALPFVEYFLQQFGWQLGTNGIANPTADQATLSAKVGQIQGQFTDGSLGGLLFAVLQYIGNWDQSTIFIEALPPQIKDIVTTLYNRIQSDVQTGSQLFNTFIAGVLGSGSQGTGLGGNTAGATGSGPVWDVIASAEVDGGNGSCRPIQSDGYSELSTDPTLPLSSLDFAALGNIPCLTPMVITNPANGKAVTVVKQDVGAGSTFNGPASGYPVMGIYPATRANLGLSDGSFHVRIQRADGKNLAPVRGTLASNSPQASTPTPPAGARREPTPTTIKTNVARVASSPTATAATASATATGTKAGKSPGGKVGSLALGRGGSTDRYQVIVEAANAINDKNFPYEWGGGHPSVGEPTGGPGTGFDCSGAVSAVMFAAGLTTVSFATGSETGTLGLGSARWPSGVSPDANGVTLFLKNLGTDQDHTFLKIGSRYWGTSGFARGASDGAGWFTQTPDSGYLAGFQPFHIAQAVLQQPSGNALPAAAGGPGGSASVPGGTGGGSSSGGTGLDAPAAAFSTMIAMPSIFQMGEALAFTGKRSFMADQPLFPFISQLCQASMRNFMSMPNGNFFAFFPDYFGIFGRKYYWEIHDIEIVDARIDLSDDPLATHVAVAGDTYTYPSGQVTLPDLLLTSGIFDIFDALTTGYIGNVADPSLDVHNFGLANGLVDSKPGKAKASAQPTSSSTVHDAGLAFLQRFGARPLVEEIPAIRNPFFELFYAFQTFMLLWSKQFETTFELTFMPELFPGGLIGLPEHNLQLYVEEVVHYFDYEQGFTTTASVSSPAQLAKAGGRSNLSQGLARPVKFTPESAVSAANQLGLGAVQGVKQVVGH